MYDSFAVKIETQMTWLKLLYSMSIYGIIGVISKKSTLIRVIRVSVLFYSAAIIKVSYKTEAPVHIVQMH